MKLIPRMRSPRHSEREMRAAQRPFCAEIPAVFAYVFHVAEGDVRFGVRLHVAREPFEAVGAHHVVGAEQFCVPAAGGL